MYVLIHVQVYIPVYLVFFLRKSQLIKLHVLKNYEHKRFFPAKFISITKSGAHLQFYIFMQQAWHTEGGQERTVHKRKRNQSWLVRDQQQSHKYLNIPSHSL